MTPGERPKARILVAVWGETYIRRFAELAVPSWLAPGNLPALARETDLEIVILTSADGPRYFDEQPVFRRLRSGYRVAFLAIDDLIGSTVYGVTLTAAYLRGVNAAGADVLRTHFVFLNSDFILADGSLESLARRIREGRRCVLAPSFRANAEDVEPVLARAVDPVSLVMAMPPREMAGLALAHLHPTTVAKTVNQSVFCSRHPNQLYWRVDEHTLLARMFLMFMLCIRPEREVRVADSFCDYGFVPEMCPSGDVCVISDSDEFFMLESQKRRQEGSQIALGALSAEHVARSLSEWTTASHRAAGQHDLVFHSRDLPPGTAAAAAEAARFVAAVSRRLGPPKPHRHHPYWVGGLQAWREQIRRAGKRPDVPELTPGEADPARPREPWRAKALRAARALLIGVRPNLRPWHYDWRDYLGIRAIAREICGRADLAVMLVDHASSIGGLFTQTRHVARIDHRSFFAEPERGAARFDRIVCVLTLAEVALGLPLAIERAVARLSEGGELVIFAHNLGGDAAPGNLGEHLVESLRSLPLSTLAGITLECSGGATKPLLRGALIALANAYYRQGPLSALWVAPLVGLLLVASGLRNALGGGGTALDYCTSALLRFRRP
jgi:hypothetical protein